MDTILVRTAESVEAVIQRCSEDNVFWKIVQNSQVNACAGVPFYEVSGLETATLLKTDSSKSVFLWILQSF